MSNCAFALFMGEFLLDSHPLYLGHSGCAEDPPVPSRHRMRVIAAAAYSCLSILKLAKYQIIHLEKSPFHQTPQQVGCDPALNPFRISINIKNLRINLDPSLL